MAIGGGLEPNLYISTIQKTLPSPIDLVWRHMGLSNTAFTHWERNAHGLCIGPRLRAAALGAHGRVLGESLWTARIATSLATIPVRLVQVARSKPTYGDQRWSSDWRTSTILTGFFCCVLDLKACKLIALAKENMLTKTGLP